MRSVLLSLSVLSLISCSTMPMPNNQHHDEPVTIRSPIDGYLQYVPKVGESYSASEPIVSGEVYALYNSLLNTIKEQNDSVANSVDEKLKDPCADVPSANNNHANGSGIEQKGTTNEDTPLFHNIESIYLPGRGETGANPVDSHSIVIVRSPVMEYQLLEAEENVSASKHSLDIAANKLALECQLYKTEDERIEDLHLYLKHSRDFEYEQAKEGCDNHRCLGKGRADELRTKGMDEAKAQGIISTRRHDFAVAYQFDGELKIAKSKYESALRLVQSIHANLDTGRVTCPRQCTIRKIYVFKDQYVTKGDPLIDVTLNAN